MESTSQSIAHADTASLSAHERLQLHELLNFKTLSAAKAKAIDGLLTDKDLKALVQEDLQHFLYAMEKLETFLRKALPESGGRIS